ncbi:MAG: DNA-binding response regulator [Caldilinea sp. CFX5]|nr:DNA-binding response regulator [Caldilinea sp. CFX5]
MSDPIKIMIADDHAHFRAGIRALLLTEDDLEMIGEAATGAEAITRSAELQPDVLLMDLNMPGMNGIDATRQIVHNSPHIAVLVISMFEDDDSVFAALQAGARGYLLKGAPKAEVLRAIRAVASGEAIFGAAIARRVIGYFAMPRPQKPANLFPELTEREQEILRLLAQHKSNGEIAAQLVLTDKTVRNYVSNICTKLQVVDRAEAILRARDAGLG